MTDQDAIGGAIDGIGRALQGGEQDGIGALDPDALDARQLSRRASRSTDRGRTALDPAVVVLDEPVRQLS